MTLYQISFTYRADAAVLRTRISELRAAARAAQDREEAERLKRRIAELQVLRRQSSELAVGGIAEIGKGEENDSKDIMSQIGEGEHHSGSYSQEYREDGYRVWGDSELIPDAGEEETDGSGEVLIQPLLGIVRLEGFMKQGFE